MTNTNRTDTSWKRLVTAEEAVATLRECLCGEFQGVEISAEASPPWQQWPDAS